MANPPPALMNHFPSTAGLAAPRPLLICFSHLRWNFVWQRPQHLMTRAARTHRVFFFEEPIPLEPGGTPRMDFTLTPQGVTIAVPRIPASLEPDLQEQAIAHLLAEMLRHEPAASLIKWYYTPMAMPFSANLAASLTVYDCMDELSAFAGVSPRLKRLEQSLMRHADVVFTGGHSLFQAKAHLHDDISAEPSSIDADHFPGARDLKDEPQDQRDIPHPRIGFFGVIDERMDRELLAGLCALRPDWQFVMIGPVAKITPESLPQSANLHWLGQRDYRLLPHYLAGWNAGFMPFALNESTRFISPTKTPEFLAAGIPVASTAVADVVRPYGIKGLVEIAGDAPGLAQALERAMQRPRGAWLAAVDTELARTSWDLTWQRMAQRMRNALARRARTIHVTPALGTLQAAGNA